MNKTETIKQQTQKDDHVRDQWGGQVEFLLACLGNAVGLGNVSFIREKNIVSVYYII